LPRLLLRGGHRDALAALRTATTQHFTSTAGLLASTEAMGALAALVVGLIGTLAHGNSPDPGTDRIQATGSLRRGSILKRRREVKAPSSTAHGCRKRGPARSVIASGHVAIRRDPDREHELDIGNRFAAIRSSLGDVFDLRDDFRNCYQRRVSSPVDKPYRLATGENQKPLWITSGLVVFCL
jgi:hypothetical protein